MNQNKNRMDTLNEKKMKEQKLIKMTNEFLKKFLYESRNKSGSDDLFNFHFTLPEILAKCHLPSYEEQNTLLMAMSSFDDNFAKEMFNKRIQGFIKIIEEKIAYKGEQDDYFLKDVVTTDYMKDDFKIMWDDVEGGERKMRMEKCKSPAQKVTFNVSNSRSGFQGNVIIYKELRKIFKDEDNYTEEMSINCIDFIYNSERVMSISYKMDYDNMNRYYEEGTFTHYKHIANINSFYQTICSI